MMTQEKYDAQPEKPPVILVVDDNVPNLELIQAYLEDVDCRVVPAHDGIEALGIVKRNKPDHKLELLTRVRTMLKLKHLTDKLQRTIAYLSEVEKNAQSTASSPAKR